MVALGGAWSRGRAIGTGEASLAGFGVKGCFRTTAAEAVLIGLGKLNAVRFADAVSLSRGASADSCAVEGARLASKARVGVQIRVEGASATARASEQGQIRALVLAALPSTGVGGCECRGGYRI